MSEAQTCGSEAEVVISSNSEFIATFVLAAAIVAFMIVTRVVTHCPRCGGVRFFFWGGVCRRSWIDVGDEDMCVPDLTLHSNTRRLATYNPLFRFEPRKVCCYKPRWRRLTAEGEYQRTPLATRAALARSLVRGNRTAVGYFRVRAAVASDKFVHM